MPAVHILGIGYEVISSGGNGFGPGSAVGLTEQRTNAVVGGLKFTQAAGPLNIALGGNYSNLNNANQFLVRGGLTWFPLGNLDLYFGGYLNTQFRKAGISSRTSLIPEYLLGAGIASKAWVEVFGSHGDMFNYTEGNGYIVYNGLDRMKHKAAMNIVVPISEKGSMIYLGGRWVRYQSRFVPLSDLTDPEINPLGYDSYSVFAGVSLRF